MDFNESIVKPFTIKRIKKNRRLKYAFIFPLDPFGRKDLSISGINFDDIFYFLNFKFMLKGEFLLAYPSFGPSQTVFLMECLIVSGIENFIFIGSCASICERKSGDVIIPHDAFSFISITRRYIDKKIIFPSSKRLNSFLKESLKESKLTEIYGGRVGTIDAVFRETPSFIENALKNECDFLDMESAPAFCLGEYYGVNVSSLFVVIDVILKENWRGKVGFISYSLRMRKILKIVENLL